MVDGDEVEAGLGGGQVGGEELGPVGQDDGEGVAAFEPCGAQAVDEAVGGGVQAAGAPLLAVGGDEGGAMGVGLGLGPEARGGVLVTGRSFRRCG